MNRIAIVGAGGIGRAAALIILNDAELNAEVFIGDISLQNIKSATDWVEKGDVDTSRLKHFIMSADGLNDEMKAAFEACEVVLDCLPGSQAPRIASFAKTFSLHYANLTEYVNETEEVKKISDDASTGFILQTGLAPGYINILAHKLFLDFTTSYGVDKVSKITMKVGALTPNAHEPYFYGFTWSPIGVATEYVKDAIVVRDGQVKNIAALSGIKSIMIDGVWYEDNYTSGGAADLPEAFKDKTRDLDYKTLRYPGHYQWVKNVLNEAPYSEDRIEYLKSYMLETIPQYEDDIVIIYSYVKGKDQYGSLRAIDQSLKISPMMIGGQTLKAIQSTTASSLVECARMLLEGNLRGTILQSQIDPYAFLTGRFVEQAYGKIIDD